MGKDIQLRERFGAARNSALPSHSLNSPAHIQMPSSKSRGGGERSLFCVWKNQTQTRAVKAGLKCLAVHLWAVQQWGNEGRWVHAPITWLTAYQCFTTSVASQLAPACKRASLCWKGSARSQARPPVSVLPQFTGHQVESKARTNPCQVGIECTSKWYPHPRYVGSSTEGCKPSR